MADRVVEINGDDAVSEVMDGEAIIINMATGCYYSLDGAGGLIWELLQKGPASASALARVLQSTFAGGPATLQDEIQSILDEMKAEGLVVDSEKPAAMHEAGSVKPRPYAPAVLNKYTDLEALLLLDPIHDVSPRGWPNKAAPGK